MKYFTIETVQGNREIQYKEEPCNDDDVNNLKTILKSTVEGNHLLMDYAICNKLSSRNRRHLADILIAHELQKDASKGPNREAFIAFALGIVKTFPTEALDYWITNELHPDKIVLNGKLMRRYNTWIRVAKCITFDKVLDGFEDCEITSELDDEENSEVEVSLAYLKILTSPWSSIEDLWIKTAKSRIEDYSKIDIYDYFQTFPCLREPLGYTLLEKDFQSLHPYSMDNLFAEWPKLSMFIENEFKKKDTKFLTGKVSKEKRLMTILMHLPQIFPVVTAIRKSDSDVWRPSKAESQASFFLVIKSLEEYQPIHERRSEKLKKYGLNIQPLTVIIGNAEKFQQCFTVLDTVIYEVDNPLKAIDLTFKLFHAFQMEYPPECVHIWTFLQMAVYKIRRTSEYKHYDETSDLIMKYLKFQQNEFMPFGLK